MFSIILDVWGQIAALKPAFISKTPHFNFITVHYFWIIGVTIIASLSLFIRGNIPYIDALFLASGAATQSGLNTININDLNTWQQVTVYLAPMVTNPITINSFVVFLRLYWFEKRFQHIATEAKKSRRSLAKSFTKIKTQERDIGHEERGVEGRSIVVMHNSTRPNGMTDDAAVSQDLGDLMEKTRAVSEQEKARSSDESGPTTKDESSESGSERARESEAQHQPQIKFADQVKRSDGLADEALRMPIQRSQEEHIAFLQRQRNPDDDIVLRIPGPRDADAGVAPVAVEETDPLDRAASHQSGPEDEIASLTTDDQSPNTEPMRPRNIDFAEPTKPTRSQPADHAVEDAVAAKHVMSVFRFRKPRVMQGTKIHEEENELHPTQSRIPTFKSIRTALSRDKEEGIPYLSWEPTIGRNSAFVDLTEAQREELGGIEYRSLKSLALILTLYFWGFSIFGVVCMLPWVLHSKTYGSIVEQDGQGRAWWGIFTPNSAFTDLGFTLTPDSMISFQTAVWPLLLLSFLVIIGNTGFPIMLRIIIWVTSKYVPRNSGIWEELKFLLDHPRRCFTLLFPSKATWWLFWILLVLNGLDLLFFIILDLGNTIVTQLPVHIRVLDGWFQAVSTRTAGFGVVNLAELHPAIQVSYLIMMYISVFPIAISVRRTNVYEEKSLGIYGSATEENEDEAEPSYVGAHLRRQLSFDLWYIFMGFFIIAISEGSRIQSGDPSFTMFSVLFEIVSAYGTVGLSLGYANIDASFSAEFGVVAKLVIIAMQIRGRHRGLPYELDRAILLPSEHLQEKEQADTAERAKRRTSVATSEYNAPVGSGAAKVDWGRSRSRSNLLGTLLHPGPTIPNSHRRDPNYHERRNSKSTFNSDAMYRERRNSKATFASGRAGRSVSPTHAADYGIPLDGAIEKKSQLSGRRSFYQEGVNNPPENNA